MLTRTLLALSLAAAPAFSTVIWNESGDAGDLPGTAQITTGGAPLNGISGAISSGTDADMYRIFIYDPAGFSASTIGHPGTLADTQLFLFNASGYGVYANDDTGTGATSLLPAGNPNGPLTPGIYYLVVSAYDRDPAAGGLQIFPSYPFTGVYGPSGPGGGSPINGYIDVNETTGTYLVCLTGASTADSVPEPGSMWLMAGGAGLLVFTSRRRRRNSY